MSENPKGPGHQVPVAFLPEVVHSFAKYHTGHYSFEMYTMWVRFSVWIFAISGRTDHSRFTIALNPTEDSTCNIKQAIGDGRIGSFIDGIEKGQIPNDLLINNCDDPISTIVESTYPDFFNHSSDFDYLQQRAILAPTLDMVESINEYMVSLNQSPEKTYLSSDIVGVPVILQRNIDQSSGLCNGTRLIITRLENQVIESKVLSSNIAGQKVFISRMTLMPSDARIPFKFQRR
uniref:DNA helicase Pif1-like 2B domain-containing protein n=1 Tax=Nicotiana tabacum TaxID=4097 RepID=A0A1S3Z248_TOBAC|nr:PREDICTED: uncharacterized protein LOC107782155 [Nicotiana tabacum]